MNIWRLQTRTGADHTIRIAEHCLDKGIAALGWKVDAKIDTYEEYLKLASKKYKAIQSVMRLATEVQSGDLIWMRNKGTYYVGLVGEESKWKYNIEAVNLDACNQRTDIKWVSSNKADESIAGAVTTSFIRGQALQKIKKDGIEQYSKYAYNLWANENRFKEEELRICNDKKIVEFFNLLTTNEAEDLVAFWLYKEKGYIAVPSTNKLSTPLYEFVMLDPNDREKRIYVQVKKGDEDIDADKYAELNGEVYLFSSEGKVVNAEKYGNIRVVTAEELYGYATREDAILSYGIRMWLDLLNK